MLTFRNGTDFVNKSNPKVHCSRNETINWVRCQEFSGTHTTTFSMSGFTVLISTGKTEKNFLRTLKTFENFYTEKILEKSGNLPVRKCGNPEVSD